MRARVRIRVLGAMALAVCAATLGSGLIASGAASARALQRKVAKVNVATPTETTASFDLSVTVQSGGTTYDGTVSGQADFSTGKAEATIDVPEGLGTVISAIDPSLASMLPPVVAADTTAQVVLSGRTVYLSFPGFSIGSDQWVSFSLPGGAAYSTLKKAAKDLENVTQLGKLAKSLGISYTSIGTQTIDGQTADGYLATIDLDSLLAYFDVPSSTTSEVTAALGPSVPVDVWAEPSGPVLLVSVDLAPPAGSTVQLLDVSFALSNWGEPVTITVPAKSEVYKIKL